MVGVIESMRIIGEIAEWQLGYVTAAQAVQHGVSRAQLHRLAAGGALERVRTGVYRAAGAPEHRLEYIWASWLALDPTTSYEQRLKEPWNGPVVMTEAATALHEVGTFLVYDIDISAPYRIQSRNELLAFHRRTLRPEDVTIVEGIPVTTIPQTIADLVTGDRDRSIIGDLIVRHKHDGDRISYKEIGEALDKVPANKREHMSGPDFLERITVDVLMVA